MAEAPETWNGAKSEALSGLLLLFFKAVRKSSKEWLAEHMATIPSTAHLIVLAFHVRDIKGGKGERQLARDMWSWLAIMCPHEMSKVLHLIPEFGRFDDLWSLRPYFPEVLNLLASQLVTDRAHMEQGKPVSLAAKWLPKKESELDEIRRIICPTLSRTHFRKLFISPLRRYLKLPEVKMAARAWSEIDYASVPSQAIKRYKKAFASHDPCGFAVWQDGLKTGTSKVNAGTLQPYQLVREALRVTEEDTVLEAQWQALEEKTAESGVFGDALCICDVSSSMTEPGGIPIQNAIAFSILISACSTNYRHQVLTFHESPEWVNLEDVADTFVGRVRRLEHAPWGGSTNLQAAFSLILQRAKVLKIAPPSHLFIFSDMQFNDACRGDTNFEALQKQFRQAGFSQMPELVFWNLAGSQTPDEAPVKAEEKGVVLISGFSPTIARYFLEDGGVVNPTEVMMATLHSKRYEKLWELLDHADSKPESCLLMPIGGDCRL